MKLITLLFVLLASNVFASQGDFLKREKKDAQKFSTIEALIFKETKFDEALSMLEPILANVPHDYGEIFKKQRRFWDEYDHQEYMVKTNDNSVPFILDAYSKVYYYLAVIHIERGNFAQAKDYLSQGLTQIPDEYHLLNEMGMLYQSNYRLSLDQKDLDISLKYYLDVIKNESFCTDMGIARALRGIGFNLIELGELDVAEKVFVKSLELDDNPKAHNELKYIEQLRNADNKKPSVSTTINSDVDITSYEYTTEQLGKLPQELVQMAVESRYVYIFSKAATFLVSGAEEYRKNDALNYPPSSWNEDRLILGCNQIVGYVRGLSPETCLENMTETEFKNLLEMFHFDLSSIENTSETDVVKGTFIHKVDKSKTVMYCRVLR